MRGTSRAGYLMRDDTGSPPGDWPGAERTSAGTSRPSRRAVLAQSVALCTACCSGRMAAGTSQVSFGGSLSYRDPRLRPVPPVRAWESTLARAPLSDERWGRARDPRFNVEYPHRLQVLLRASLRAPGQRRFVVHYREDAEAALARLAGSMLARLHWLAFDYLGRLCPPSEPGAEHVDLWLSTEGEPGGEEFGGHLYLFAVRVPRAPAEWARELAHEFAHRVLPRIGPYREPETWGEGYLGERLFLKWLLADNGVTDLWDGPVSAEGYLSQQIAPLRNRFLDEGPAAPAARRTDVSGMEFFIGQLLALEAAHGPHLLRDLFRHFITPRPQNLPIYLETVQRSLSAPVLEVAPPAFIPSASEWERGPGPEVVARTLAYWVFLAGGPWSISAAGELPEGTELFAEERRLGQHSGSWVLPESGPNGMWRRLRLVAPSGQFLRLRSLRLERGRA